MKRFVFDVIYDATVIEKTVVEAKDRKEAKEKIKRGDIKDVLDEFVEVENAVDFVLIDEREIE